MAAEKSNAALLYEIIDTLTDEEFKELLDILAISNKVDNDDVDVVKEKEIIEKEDVDERVKAIQEKLETIRRRRKIQEKLESARRAKETKSREDEIRAKIQERLEVARRKKAIQERVMKLRNN